MVGHELVRCWSDVSQMLVNKLRCWSDVGQLLVRCWSDVGLILVRCWSLWLDVAGCKCQNQLTALAAMGYAMKLDLDSALNNVKGSTKIATFRRYYTDIEEKLSQGVTHEQMVAALNEAGFDINFDSFRTCLYRCRRERANQPQGKEKVVRPDGHSQERERAVGKPPEPAEESESLSDRPSAESQDEGDVPTGRKGLEEILAARSRDDYGSDKMTRRKSLLRKKST